MQAVDAKLIAAASHLGCSTWNAKSQDPAIPILWLFVEPLLHVKNLGETRAGKSMLLVYTINFILLRNSERQVPRRGIGCRGSSVSDQRFSQRAAVVAGICHGAKS